MKYDYKVEVEDVMDFCKKNTYTITKEGNKVCEFEYEESQGDYGWDSRKVSVIIDYNQVIGDYYSMKSKGLHLFFRMEDYADFDYEKDDPELYPDDLEALAKELVKQLNSGVPEDDVLQKIKMLFRYKNVDIGTGYHPICEGRGVARVSKNERGMYITHKVLYTTKVVGGMCFLTIDNRMHSNTVENVRRGLKEAFYWCSYLVEHSDTLERLICEMVLETIADCHKDRKCPVGHVEKIDYTENIVHKRLTKAFSL